MAMIALQTANAFSEAIGNGLRDIWERILGIPRDTLYSLIPALWIILVFANDNFGRYALDDPHLLMVDDNMYYTTWRLMLEGWGFYDAFIFAYQYWSVSGGVSAVYRAPMLFQVWALFPSVSHIKVLYFLLGSAAMFAAFFMSRRIGGNAAYGVLSMLFLLEVIPTNTWFMTERWAIAVGIIGLYFFISDSPILASSLFFLSFSFKDVMLPLPLFASLYAVLFKRKDRRALSAYTLGFAVCLLYITVHNLLAGKSDLGNYSGGLMFPYFALDSGVSFALGLRGWGDLSLLSTVLAFLGMTTIKDDGKKLFFLTATLFSHLFITNTVPIHRHLAPAVALEVPMVPLSWRAILIPMHKGDHRKSTTAEGCTP